MNPNTSGSLRWLVVTLALTSLVACGDAGDDFDDDGDEVAEESLDGDFGEDADAPVEAPERNTVSSPLCDSSPVVTYERFGRGFLTARCQSCHASSSVERYGAPEDVVFDTLADVETFRERILARSTGDTVSMPPGGGLSDDDKTMLTLWLTCQEPLR